MNLSGLMPAGPTLEVLNLAATREALGRTSCVFTKDVRNLAESGDHPNVIASTPRPPGPSLDPIRGLQQVVADAMLLRWQGHDRRRHCSRCNPDQRWLG